MQAPEIRVRHHNTREALQLGLQPRLLILRQEVSAGALRSSQTSKGAKETLSEGTTNIQSASDTQRCVCPMADRFLKISEEDMHPEEEESVQTLLLASPASSCATRRSH